MALCTFALAFTSLVSPLTTEGWTKSPTYKISYRNPAGYWNRTIRNGRAVLDQIEKNDGRDDILDNFDEQRLQELSAFAEHDIKTNNEFHFRDRMRAIERSMGKLTTREYELRELKKKIDKELKTETKRFDKLIKGTKAEDHLRKALDIKPGKSTGSKILDDIRDTLLTTLPGTVGRISQPIIKWINLFIAGGEWADLELLMPRLFEMTEMVALLNLQLNLYDQAIVKHEKLIDRLNKLHDEKKNQEVPEDNDNDESSNCAGAGAAGKIDCVAKQIGE